MKPICILIFLIVSSILVNAQGNSANGKISGKVIDAATQLPVEYATISILKAGTTSPFNGVVSDAKGNFTLSSVPNGEFTINIDFIGYKRSTTEHIIISNTTKSVVLNNILLAPVQNQLKSVEVVGNTPVVENKIDKLVYNAANDLTSQSGVALDVLKKVPMVSLDSDGNVELQGDANIRFLINGKPSSIFGSSLTDALQAIPASQIKSIEVITNPGAKYDVQGTGGIVNIILKDNRVEGVNGSVNASAGTRLENTSVNLNARKGKFGAGFFFSGNEQLNTITNSSTNDQSTDATTNTTTDQLQSGNSKVKRNGYQTGLNFQWDITR